MKYKIINDNCLNFFAQQNLHEPKINLTFLDPPFNQQKDYTFHDDDMSDTAYWAMIKTVCQSIYNITQNGGAIYFMQREKNAEFVLSILRETGWIFQNLIIWKKKTSAVPVKYRFSKHYQIIVYATKGDKACCFNRLRINPELPTHYKQPRENGVFVTDVWDDIRELTSGYFAGEEAIKTKTGERFHKQQAPISLLLRILLTSSQVGDVIFDPFAGTGTTLVVAHQLHRHAIGVEIDPVNVECIKSRLENIKTIDSIERYYNDYLCTDHLDEIWGNTSHKAINKKSQPSQLSFF